MVGGQIIELIYITRNKWWVNTKDKRDECGVFFNPQDYDVRVYDSLWWQANICYWTPKGNHSKYRPEKSDIRLPKIGYSGVTKKSALEERTGNIRERIYRTMGLTSDGCHKD